MSGHGSQKRQGGFDHYGGGSSQKYPRPGNPNYAPRGPNQNPHNNNFPNAQSIHVKSKDRRGETAHFDYIDRQPDPSKCVPCKLAKQEADAGLIALLTKVEADELVPEGDKDILRCANELRRLLSARNNVKHSQRAKELDKGRPFQGQYVIIPEYIGQKMEQAKSLPPLPPIVEPRLLEQVFTHASVHETKGKLKGITSAQDLSYEHLEFIGDAYLEVLATRLIAHRLPHLDVPSQAHFREQLVRNDTLSKFSNDYGLPDRLKHASHLKPSAKVWTKITADVFEAYVAAVVLSDPVEGFLTAEKWMNQLWAQQMIEYREPILVENMDAQAELDRAIFMNHIKINYAEDKEMEMTKLGVQQFHQGVYLTGWGYDNEWLGSGVGRNKQQAAVNAAQDALTRNNVALQTAIQRKKEFLNQQQVERDQKRGELRKRADAGDEEAMAELSRILKNDIRVKKRLAGKGDQEAAARLEEFIAEEATLTEQIEAKRAGKDSIQSRDVMVPADPNETKGPTQAQRTVSGNADVSPVIKHKKNKDSKGESPKLAKDSKQSAEDFLANIMSGGTAMAKRAQEATRDGSSWLDKEQKKKEKEERKREKRDKKASPT